MSGMKENSKTSTYVVDGEYRLQYVSDGLREILPKLKMGVACYQQFRGREEPCRNCPLTHPRRKTDMFYNEDAGKWLKINAGRIDWPGAKDCHVILTKDVEERDFDEMCRFVNMKREILERKNFVPDKKNRFTGLYPREVYGWR